MDILRAAGVGVIALAIGTVSGCLYGRADGSEERGRLAERLASANLSVEVCAGSLYDLREQQAEELRKVEEQAQAAQQAAEDLARENLDLAAKTADLEQQIAQARMDPTCRDQMEVELCPAIPLL